MSLLNLLEIFCNSADLKENQLCKEWSSIVQIWRRRHEKSHLTINENGSWNDGQLISVKSESEKKTRCFDKTWHACQKRYVGTNVIIKCYNHWNFIKISVITLILCTSLLCIHILCFLLLIWTIKNFSSIINQVSIQQYPRLRIKINESVVYFASACQEIDNSKQMAKFSKRNSK